MTRYERAILSALLITSILLISLNTYLRSIHAVHLKIVPESAKSLTQKVAG